VSISVSDIREDDTRPTAAKARKQRPSAIERDHFDFEHYLSKYVYYVSSATMYRFMRRIWMLYTLVSIYLWIGKGSEFGTGHWDDEGPPAQEELYILALDEDRKAGCRS
jgi:hypothetical protein